MTDATYQMLWDCKFCGQKKLLGLTHRFCPSCGGPQDATSRYFPPDAEKVAVENHPYVGADIACPACEHWNGRASKCCGNCGSPLQAGKDALLRQDQVHAEGVDAPSDTAQAAHQDFQVPGTAPKPVSNPPEKRSHLGCFLSIIAVVAVLALGIFVMFAWKRTGAFEVVGHSWERKIEIEAYGPGRKTAWCDEMPGGAKELSRRKEQKSTSKVQDGEDCQKRRKDMGDGTFKEVRECSPKYKEVPVLADRCDFEVMGWKTSRTLSQKGTSLKDSPSWPRVDLAKTGTCVGCEREGKRTETYTVRFVETKTKKDTSCDTPQGTWSTLAVGKQYQGTVSVVGGSVNCDSLKPK
ncbi:MAG: hypothetical protein WCI05_05485 [Myxococcales bacterium]